MKKIVSKLRVFFWLVAAFFSRFRKHLLFGFIGGFFLFLISLRVFPVISIFFPQRKVIGLVGRYTPTTLPLALQNLISFGLTRVNQAGEALPSLATSWEAEEEGKIYLFRLRENVYWHDGLEFTADDINYNLKGAEIKALDRYTVQFKLNEPFTPLPALLSRPLFKKGLTGTGVYKVANLRLNVDRIDSITLIPLLKEEKFPHLTYRFYPTEADVVTAFKLGEVDVLQDLSDLYNLSSWPQIEIEKEILSHQVVTIFYNTSSDLLKEKAFRQGLNYAFPDLQEEKAWGPISPTSWAFSQKVKVFQFDPEKATSLLRSDDLATATASLKLSTFPHFLSLAQKIATSWGEFGIKTQIQIENIIPQDFDALLTIQEIPADPDQYPLWHSTQEQTNFARLKSPKIDKLLEDGRKTFAKEARKEIYADFQKYLADEAPAAFLYYPTVYTVSRK